MTFGVLQERVQDLTTNMTYLDYNATTPVLPAVREAMWPFVSEEWGNPSSLYRFGGRAKTAIDGARARVAALVRAKHSSALSPEK
jgi:cysteine sulfinate desulfinase/cysteine desulfurase-like protein